MTPTQPIRQPHDESVKRRGEDPLACPSVRERPLNEDERLRSSDTVRGALTG